MLWRSGIILWGLYNFGDNFCRKSFNKKLLSEVFSDIFKGIFKRLYFFLSDNLIKEKKLNLGQKTTQQKQRNLSAKSKNVTVGEVKTGENQYYGNMKRNMNIAERDSLCWCDYWLIISITHIYPLSANPTKWSDTPKQLVGNSCQTPLKKVT